MMPNPDPAEDGQIADKETMWTIAWFQIAFMGVLVAANLVVMVSKQIGTVKRKCLISKLKNNQKKKIIQRKKQHEESIIQKEQ